VRAIFHKIVILSLLLITIAAKSYSATYDWVGTTATSGVYNWNTPANWQIAGVTATTKPSAIDIVRIAVNSFSYAPTVTDAESCASIVFGTYDNFTLTVTGALTVTGNITQNNDPNFYQYTVLAGTGTITCGSFTVGDNTQPSSYSGVVVNVSSQVSKLTVNGNITLNAVGNSSGNGIDYPYFSLDANQLTLSGQIVTTTYSNPLYGGVGNSIYPGLGLFQMDTGSANTTLELLNVTPIATPITSGFTIDFTNAGTGTGTTLYDAASGSQTIYATGTSGIGINPQNYDNITFSGASTKVVGSGALTVTNTLTTGGTGAVNLNTNNPTVTISGNLVNSTAITQGTGSITVTGTMQNNSGTVTLGSGAFTAGTLQINAGTITGSSGAITVTSTFQNNSGTLTGGTGTITFDGNYTNSSTFTPGTGMIYFSGTTAQTLVDNGTTGTNFTNVTFNGTNTVTMGAGVNNFTVAANGTLTMVGSAKLVTGTATAAYLTLKSSATSSATVAAIPGTASISGFINVQRYITGGSSTYRGYRLLSSPVYASTVSGNNVVSINYPISSCYVTGSTGTTGGFDKTGNPTLYLYRENLAPGNNSFITGNFRGINNITTNPSYSLDNETGTFNIPAGSGFLFFFRGNRSTTLASKTVTPFTAPENTILTATGTLNQGQITIHDWYTPASATVGYTTTAGNTAVRGYNLVGNPYASSINWDLFNTTTSTSGIYGVSVGTTIYVLDPVSKNYGAYVSGTGGVGTHNTSNILPSGQGFFVVGTAATAKLVFNESAKVTTQVTGTSLLMGLPKNMVNLQYMNLMLAKDSVNTDDIIIHLNADAGTAYNPQTEAIYHPGFGQVNLSSLTSDSVALAINSQPFPKTRSKIALSVSAMTDGTYQLSMKNIVGIPKLYSIWLIDNYTKDSVDMRTKGVYSFTITKSDSSSFGARRFMLSISQNPAFAYQLINFSAARMQYQPTREVQLNWNTENEANYTTFTVERSKDGGNTFEVVGGKQGNGSGYYGIVDEYPQAGLNVYRLKQQDINNNITYSAPVTVEYTILSNYLTNSNVHVYPNPAKSNITLTIANESVAKSQNYKIRISNSSGLMVRDASTSLSNWQSSVGDLSAGTYLIQVITSNGSLVGETKFVKL